MPPSEVGFRLTLDAKHEGGHFLKVKYNWFTVGAPAAAGEPPVITPETLDTGHMKDWNLIQIEGEEPVEEAADDAKGGKKAAPAKGAKGGAGALEEITDNRPREIKYVKDWGGEDVKMKITEEVAHHLEATCL